jgi:hypothetical protein
MSRSAFRWLRRTYSLTTCTHTDTHRKMAEENPIGDLSLDDEGGSLKLVSMDGKVCSEKETERERERNRVKACVLVWFEWCGCVSVCMCVCTVFVCVCVFVNRLAYM